MVTPADHSAPSASLTVLAEEVVLPVVIFLEEGWFAMVARGWGSGQCDTPWEFGESLLGWWVD